jgi:3-methyl-2-oxobutanoate hydroxymethyltransferase
MPVTIQSLVDRKRHGERFAMLTAYDYTTARILAEAEIPVLLVGDSLGMVMLGYPNTLPVTMEEMLHHARAVARGAPDQLLVGDMPFNSYHASDEQAIANAASFLQAGMHAVKVEGGGRVVQLVAKLTERGIPVMGHLGLTPQFVNLFGGFRVQGRQAEAAARIQSDARELEAAGAFAVVLEGTPRTLAGSLTGVLTIPTIGIGAGPDCDGQVLVFHDVVGLNRDHLPKFVKVFAPLGDQAVAAARAYAAEVAAGTFPDDAHSYA